MHNMASAEAYALFPACDPGNTAYTGYTAVRADFGSSEVVQIGAGLDAFFGMAGCLALLLHILGVEIYLKLTWKEAQRLKRISAERQLSNGSPQNASIDVVVEHMFKTEGGVTVDSETGDVVRAEK